MDTLACFLCRQGRALSTQVCCHGCAWSTQITHWHSPSNTPTLTQSLRRVRRRANPETFDERETSFSRGECKARRRVLERLPRGETKPVGGPRNAGVWEQVSPEAPMPGGVHFGAKMGNVGVFGAVRDGAPPLCTYPLSPPTNKRRVCAHLMGIYVPFLQGRREDVELCVVL